MSEKRTYKLVSDQVRAHCIDEIARAPLGKVVIVQDPTRTLEQSAKFHAMCSDVAKSGVLWSKADGAGGRMGLKQKTCKSCRQKFTPTRPMQSACSTACAIAIAERKREKQAQQMAAEKRRETRQRLESMKGIPELIHDAQTACNAYVRVRDDGKPCISCGTLLSREGVGGGFDAGHFRSRGAAPHLRFHEHNVAGQCKRCNRHMAGNVSAMRIGLIGRYGLEAVEALENDNGTHKWTRDELKMIKAEYIMKRKEIEA